MPAISESMESTYSRSMLYNYPDREHITSRGTGSIQPIIMNMDFYEPTKDEEIYLVQEAVKILCQYPAFQVLECPYGRNQY